MRNEARMLAAGLVGLSLGLGAGSTLAGLGSIGDDGGYPPAVGGAPATAERAPVLSGKRRPPTPREPTAGLPKASFEQPPRWVIKCWQWGRLIFEERNWQPGAQAFASLRGWVFKGGSGGYDHLYLASFGETFCFIKGASGPADAGR